MSTRWSVIHATVNTFHGYHADIEQRLDIDLENALAWTRRSQPWRGGVSATSVTRQCPNNDQQVTGRYLGKPAHPWCQERREGEWLVDEARRPRALATATVLSTATTSTPAERSKVVPLFRPITTRSRATVDRWRQPLILAFFCSGL
jgi:hypothetical protein